MIVTSRRSANARNTMTRGGSASCITRSPTAPRTSPSACGPAPGRVLDVGCGTGYLLGRLAARASQAEVLAGIDAAPAMIEAARGAAADVRLRFVVGVAEQLPWPAASFDLVVITTSFDHWADQRAGLAECARVLAPGGCLVLADLFSVLLAPTLLRPAGQGAHQAAGNPAGDGGRTALGAVAPALRRHHPGRDGYQIIHEDRLARSRRGQAGVFGVSPRSRRPSAGSTLTRLCAAMTRYSQS